MTTIKESLKTAILGSNFNIVNGLISSNDSTNLIKNIIISILIPILLNLTFDLSDLLKERIQKLYKKIMNLNYYTYTIEHAFLESSGTYELSRNNNKHLYDAVIRYLDVLDINIENIVVNVPYYEGILKIYYEQISALKIFTQPSKDIWVPIKCKDVSIMIDKHVTSLDNKFKISNMIHIRSIHKESINKFLEDAFIHYKKNLTLSYSNNNRYLYTYLDNYKDKYSYSMYELYNYKKLDNIFIPNKDILKNLIDDFQFGRGRYAIDGIKKQLGLLLYGPPGTGKTSLIKSLSYYLNRHIVSVPLSKIKTNGELIKIFFDKQFYIEKDVNCHIHTYDYNKLIFIIEDIDAVSDLVKDRSVKSEDSDESIDFMDSDESDKEHSDSGHANDDSGHANDIKKLIKNKQKFDVNDKLTFACLLNCIDGVIECPDRLIIFTTNHPEQIDSALTRPGRIDFKLHLDYMKVPEIYEMCKWIFNSEPTSTQKENIIKAIVGKNYSPADIEQLLVMSNDIEEFIEKL